SGVQGNPVMIRLVCRACGKRLKLPDDIQPKRSAKCPRCHAAVDLTAALEASAYKSTTVIPTMAAAQPSQPTTATNPSANTAPSAQPKNPAPSAPSRPASLIGDDDPLPYERIPHPSDKKDTPERHETNEKNPGSMHAPPHSPGVKSLGSDSDIDL